MKEQVSVLMIKETIGRGILISVLVLALIAQGCEKDVYVEPSSDVQYSYARVYISSNPAGATIYVNGKTTGLLTPDTVRWITTGDYHITLKRDYFFDTTFTVNAINNKVTSGFVDYYQSDRMLGSMNCTSTPSGAKIYLDNEYTGRITPFVFTRMIPHLYSVKYEYPEYRKDSLKVAVRSSGTGMCNLTLDDTLDVINYNTKNSNLPSDDYTCIAEDKYGNMWFGTSADGLVKFDGKRFYRYTDENTSAITSNYTRRMIKDKEGNLWIGLSNGIVRYNGIDWYTIQTNMVTSLKVSSDNRIIAATNRGGLVEYYNGEITRIHSTENGLQDNDLASACIDNTGTLWAGIFTGGIDTYNTAGWKYLTTGNGGLPDNCNSALELDADGMLFGIFRSTVDNSPAFHTIAKYENGKWTKIFSALVDFYYNNIHVDNKNAVWFGLGDKIYRIKDKTNAVYISSIVHPNVRKLKTGPGLMKYTSGNEAFVDSKGNLWIIGSPILTYRQGIIKIKSGRWE